MKAYQSCRRHETLPYALFSATSLRWLALAVVCIGLTVPAQAAKKAPKTAATAETSISGKDGPQASPGEVLAKAMFARGKASEKDILAVLLPLQGTWDYQESFWTDPKVEPSRSLGTVTSDMILGDRYLSSKVQGFVSIGGQQEPLEGQELIGFDTVKKTFSSVYVDTLTTGMMIGAGTFNDKKHTLTEKGRFTNPLTGAEQAFRAELTLVDADNYKRVIFATDKAGKETKLIEIDYTRHR